MNSTDKIIKIVLAILFIGCLTDMPYGYFQLVRFFGMIGFGILAYNANVKKDNIFFVIWLASAILINPIVKISLGRTLWNVIDVIWAIMLLGSLFMENKKQPDRDI
ncbi:MAG: hypothetical protein KF734_02610 [Saprospiraceae bacterium]|nr:hypothetical protein [Saprospiraceae bacterium]